MNQIFVFAKFVLTPSEKEKEIIEQEITAFLKRISSQVDLEAKSGSGSWWILIEGLAPGIAGWLLTESVSWLFGKSLDKGLDKLSSQKDSNNLATTLNTINLSSNSVRSSSEINDKRTSINNLINVLDSKNLKFKEVVFREWSEHSKGLCIKVEKVSNEEFTAHILQTDNKNDFDVFS